LRRTDQRRAAVFALYQHELTGQPLDNLLGSQARALTRALAEAVETRRDEVDALIERHSHGWTLDRIAPLERAILRVAILEILHGDDLPGDEPIPPEGAVDEAVETAKQFCSADAPGFVNGVLGAVLRARDQSRS
jgi:N utilization substance protein B